MNGSLSPPLSFGTIQTVGRKEELRIYHSRFAANQTLIIQGQSGIGKSSLAAMLLRDFKDAALIRIDCAEAVSSTLNDVLWQIARILDDKEFETFLKENYYLPYPNSEKLGYIFDYLLPQLSRDCVFYFENLQVWYDKPLLINLIQRLLKYLQGHSVQTTLRLILETRSTPPFLHLFKFDYLKGASLTDLKKILNVHQKNIPASYLKTIRGATKGHPFQSLIMAEQLAAMSQSALDALPASLDEFSHAALGNQALENEVAFHTYDALSPEEKLIMLAVSIFTEAASPEMLKAILQGEAIQNIQSHRRSLTNKFILEKESLFSHNLALSPLYRQFCLNEADADLLARLHQRAVRYYEQRDETALAEIHRQKARQNSL
ncbi:MAG: hypothetical protein B6243_05690 [Anaerolineaceae bacterium 4572_5.2]|nr:MAG: hypothetical protein B6243_05690 [Anaerolineaceae bacterium 4572_5.2]